jgi:tRNA(Ile)-lysidine synthase
MPVCSVMASTRKRVPRPDPVERQLLAALRDALADCGPAEAAAPRGRRARPDAAVLIAFSGGRDSMALLDAACRLRRQRAPGFGRVLPVHVHHGLLAQADEWVHFCETTCARLDVPLDVRHVTVARSGRGLEDAARAARYAALAAAAFEHGAAAVLTAHHLDDRIETFLMHWMRGAGIDGLTGFVATRDFAGTRLLRPWLAVPRADIERYVALRELQHVEDPSNAEPRLLRSALRSTVLPPLKAIRPGFARGAARSIELLTEAAEVVHELAAGDLAACTEDAPEGMLRLDRLTQLSDARRAATVRAWLAARGLQAPPRARLVQIVAQALAARSDSRMRVRLGASEVRRHRGLLLLRASTGADRSETTICWRGESEIAIPAWGGVLRFASTGGEGFDPGWLRAEALHLRNRGGGERFKPHALRPSKTLKRLFQDAGVAEFDRGALPLVWRDGRLIFVAGLGADARLVERGEDRIRLEWLADAALIGAG